MADSIFPDPFIFLRRGLALVERNEKSNGEQNRSQEVCQLDNSRMQVSTKFHSFVSGSITHGAYQYSFIDYTFPPEAHRLGGGRDVG